MTDIALVLDDDTFTADLMLSSGALVADDGLRTAILISLFTDARASEDANLPEEGNDRCGWWGDQFAEGAGVDAGTSNDRNRIGSLLWLLGRGKATDANLRRAKQWAEEALGWLVRDRVASRVSVEVAIQPIDGIRQRLAIGVDLYRPGGPDRQRFDFTWEASVT